MTSSALPGLSSLLSHVSLVEPNLGDFANIGGVSLHLVQGSLACRAAIPKLMGL